MTPTKFTLTITMGNDAMRSRADVIGALGAAVQNIRHDYEGRIRDDNGNTVGEWHFDLSDSPDGSTVGG
jgi:hypothetical protein